MQELKIARSLIKHFWELQEIEKTIIACFCHFSYCLRNVNEKLKDTNSCNTQESMIRRHAVFSSFNNYLYVYKWRNHEKNLKHPSENRKSKPYTCKLCNKNSCCWNITKVASFKCFERKWVILWQIFDRTHTGEKPIHLQAMQHKLLFWNFTKMASLRCF